MEIITSKSFVTPLGPVFIEVYDSLKELEKNLKYVCSKVPQNKVRYASNVKLKTVEDGSNIKLPNYIETRLRKVGDDVTYWILKHEINEHQSTFTLYVRQDIKMKVNVKKEFFKKHKELNKYFNDYLNEILTLSNKDELEVISNVECDHSIPEELKEFFESEINIRKFEESVFEAKRSKDFLGVCEAIHYVAGTPSSWGAIKKLNIQFESNLDVVPDKVFEYIFS